jgi:hypothetical protein
MTFYVPRFFETLPRRANAIDSIANSDFQVM